MNIGLTEEETAALLKELTGIIGGDRYLLSPRIKTLKAIRAKIRPEPVRESLPPPPKHYAPPRAKRPRAGRLPYRQTRRNSSIQAMTSPALPAIAKSGLRANSGASGASTAAP
jgi:hypothetical protein